MMGVEIKAGVKYAYFKNANMGLLGFATTPKGDQYRIWYFQVCVWSIHCREKAIRKEFVDVRDMEKWLEKN